MKFRLAPLFLFAIAATVGIAFAKDDYKLGPDSEEQAGVPKGEMWSFPWESQVFPNTKRNVEVYVPKQYDGSKPAAVMVFQDGPTYSNRKGQFRVPVVLDNLIAKKELPVMVGIFITPGDLYKDEKKSGSNRSFEYDTLSADYAKMLEKEILPEVEKKIKLSSDPKMRGICGISSGGICAFTVAWERPDLFTKVLSHVGSFTNIRGGDRYPGMIRKAPVRPIRVFLQEGTNDLDNEHGSWPLGNQQMEAALKYKNRYDYKTAWGDGGHNGKHGGAILPDSMRWLWREEGKTEVKDAK